MGQDEYATARRTVDRAQQMILGEKFSEAGSLLGDLGCGADVNCETLKQFSRGFLYEAWAQANPENRPILLARAVEFYGDAQRLSPDNVQILTNLALAARSAGDLATATDSAAQLVTLDSTRAYEHSLFLGDLLLARDDRRGAMRAYQSAIELNEAKPEAHSRILNLRIKTGNSREVFAYSKRLSRSFPEVAVEGFSFVINSDFKNDVERSEKALTLWSALRANLGQMGEPELDTLPRPEIWQSDGIAELHHVFSGRRNSLSWWSETDDRRDAISRVLRRRAMTIRATSNLELENRQRAALVLLRKAVDIAPPVYAYLRGSLENSTNAQLDAATDLVTLHHEIKAGGNYSELSGVSAGQLKEMTNVLFDGKAGAYAAGQLEAIQRYHTVLGMVYYETGRIRSDWADNAQYQLYHALKTADRIAATDPGLYKPLPELERMLAEVYFKRQETKEGAERSLRAAMGFLETDNLPAATEALTLAKDSGADRKKSLAVATILGSRELLQARGMQAVEVEGQTVTLNAELNWLLDPNSLDLDADFIARQRFKVLSDLGSELGKAGHVDLSRTVSAQALDAARGQKVLTSLQDIRRIQSIESSLSAGSVKLSAAQRPKVTRQLGQRQPTGSEQVWALPLSTGSITVQTNPQLIEAARNSDRLDESLPVLRANARSQR
jgi:tetratricopeptide (TPR) repeat protein